MDTALAIPDSRTLARDEVYRAAVDRTLSHPSVSSAIERSRQKDDAPAIDLTRELREKLNEAQTLMLSAVPEQANRVDTLYRMRKKLRNRVQVEFDQQPWRVRDKGSDSSRTQHRLEDTEQWEALVTDTQQALADLEDALVNQALIPFCKRWLHERRETLAEDEELYRRGLDDVDLRDLRKPVTTHSFLVTRQLTDLGRLLARMPGGSVGISGPRGSGKSTAIANVQQLMTSATGREYDVFQVDVSAPVEYVPREFLSYLHARICTDWLKRYGSGHVSKDLEAGASRGSSAWLLATVILPIVMASAGSLLLARYAISVGLDGMPEAAPLLVVIVATVAAAVMGVVVAARRRLASELSREYDTEEQRIDVDPRSRRHDELLTLILVIGLAAGLLVTVRASGAIAWLGLREVGGILLVVIATTVVVALRVPRLNFVSESSTALLLVTTAVISATASLGLQGIGLLFPEGLYFPTPQVLLAGALLPAAASLGAIWRIRPATSSTDDDGSLNANAMAIRDLRRLAFQRTESSQWTTRAKIAAAPYLPVDLESSSMLSTSDAEVALGTPQVTKMICDFLSEIRRENPEESFKIVIGIDELDKLEGDEGAKGFLNEIKGVFSVPEVIFLVSVSEDAMASFERRGLAFRDVFDSAFDEIVHIPQLRLAESRDLVAGRVDNLPRPMGALAHCLSAGLTRDIIRALDHMSETAPPQALSRVTESVVHSEIRGKWQAVVAAIRAIPLEPQVTDVLKALYPIDRCPQGRTETSRCVRRTDAFALVRQLQFTMPEGSELSQFRTLQRLSGEYLGFTYFSRTLLEFFDVTSAGALVRFKRAEGADHLERHSIDHLARARRNLGINPRLGWEQVSLFRAEHEMLCEPFPDALLTVAASVPVESRVAPS